MAQAISWSPDAEQYLQLLGVAREDRTPDGAVPDGRCAPTSALLSYLPAGAFVYGAVPNPGGKIGEGLAAGRQQAFENAAVRRLVEL